MPLSDYLTQQGKFAWRHVDCVEHVCPLRAGGTGPLHHHLVSAELANVRVDIEPVYWGTTWQRPPWQVMWWAFRATLQVFLAHFVAALLHTAKKADEYPRSWSVKGSLNLIKELTYWYFRALMLSLLSIPAAFLTAVAVLCPSIRSKCLDALAWTADPGTSQEIRKRVEPRLRLKEPGLQQVLVGHSQGGSILTTIALASPHRGKKTTLITLGSGQGLLAVLNAFPKSSLGSALIFQVIFSFIMLFSLTQVLPLVQLLIRWVIFVFETVVSVGQILWFAVIAPETAHAVATQLLQDEIDLWILMLKSYLTLNPLEGFSLLVPLFVAVAVLVAANRGSIQILAEAVAASCRPHVRGVDISAKHDYISSLLSVFSRQSPRFQRIPQTGSFPADHLNYFNNGPLALEPIIRAVESHASHGSGPEANFGVSPELEKRQRTDLHLAKGKAWFCWLFLSSAIFPALQSPPLNTAPLLTIGALALLGLGTWIGQTISTKNHLAVLTGHSLDGRYGLRAEAHHRTIATSKMLALACAAAVLPAWGAFVFGMRSPVAGLPSLGATAITASVVATLLPAIPLLWGGLQRGLGWAITGFTLSAFMWSLQSTLYGFVIAAAHLLLVGWCARKLRHLNKLTSAAPS
ncbi:hypothetical protein [Arthrobacter woluwensis]|uniref:hypothetical protein n=1 Tax=Arthrobacter woluwensis TaxID=156980 RepID=UPI0037FDBE83